MSFLKFILKDKQHWLVILILLIVWCIAFYNVGYPILLWAIPIGAYIFRSYLMYKKK